LTTPVRSGYTLLNRVPSGKFNRVKMNVTDKFQEIGILLTENGFITVLKEMTVTIVSSVEGHGISSKDSSHYRRYGYCACTKEEVDMVGDQGPTITACRGLL